MVVSLHRERTFAVLLMVDAMFVVLHVASRVASWNGASLVKRHEFIDLGAEISFPTWWQQSQLLFAAALCLLVSTADQAAEGSRRRAWVVLGAIFVFLSADEGTQFHEGFIEPTREAFDISGGLFTHAWVIPGALALVVFGVAYSRFWWRLPAHPRWLVAAGGACFVVGAIGLEMVGGNHRSGRGEDRTYEVIVAIEEGMEMLGASVFVLGLLTALRSWQEGGSVVRIVNDAPATEGRLAGRGRRVTGPER